MIRQALRRKQAYNISFEETDLVIGTPESLDQYYKKYQESGGSSQIELMGFDKSTVSTSGKQIKPN